MQLKMLNSISKMVNVKVSTKIFTAISGLKNGQLVLLRTFSLVIKILKNINFNTSVNILKSVTFFYLLITFLLCC